MTSGGESKSRWVDVGAQVRELNEESWNQYWTEMTAAESMEFLKDPKTPLVEEGLIGEDFRIQTHLINTDVSIAGAADSPSCKTLLVFPDEKLALLMVYRHPT